MDQLFNEIRARIPANKFYPPVLESSQYLTRKRLLQNLHRRSSKIIFLEAQAGQGKTVLAAQYLEQGTAPFAWYQIGAEDGDPVLCLTALLSCLMEALPGFRSPLLETMIAKGEVSPLELPRFANILLGDLDIFLPGEFLVVFDDLHLLENCKVSLGLLGHILDTAPPKLRFVLAARRPVDLDLPILKYGRQTVTVSNEELALTEREIAELYNDILQVPVAGQTVRELYEATEGWTMGLLLAAHTLGKKGRLSPGAEGEKGNLRDYLQAEIFAGIPRELHASLLRLAWLDRIPVVLAAKLSEVSDIGTRLSELSHKNFFVRSLDEKDRVFRFHHLFQEYLQQRAEQELSRQEVREVLGRAADWCLEQKRSEEALGYYLKAQDYDALERVLGKEGMALYGMNRVVALGMILKKIPEEIIPRYGWLAFFSGVLLLDAEPLQAIYFLRLARKNFSKQNNKPGELLALSQIIYFHVAVDGEFSIGVRYLNRAEEIYEQVSEGLEESTEISVLHNMAIGFCFFQGDMLSSKKYSSVAFKKASEGSYNNLLAAINVTRGFEFSLIGNYGPCFNIVEEGAKLLSVPGVGMINYLGLLAHQMDFLEMQGDFESFKYHEQFLKELVKDDVIAQSIVYPYLLIWNIGMQVAMSEYDKALSLVEKGLNSDYAAGNANMRGQFLHYLSFIKSIHGEKNIATAAAEDSLELRSKVGGGNLVALNYIMICASYINLKFFDKADLLLKVAVKVAEDLDSKYYICGAYFQRALLSLKQEKIYQAIEDIRKTLVIMQQNNYSYFYGYTSESMELFLQAAVKHRIEVDYARYLASERLGLAILPDGTSIPLLQINTLGGLTLTIEDNVVLNAEGLTQTQRELLALLIASPGLKKCQEKIQAALWPESSPDKSRANFDNLLMRLRKTLSQAIKPHAVKHYLSLQKGILCLENCRLDAAEFAQKARRGLEHARRKEFWQAGNSFHSAHNLWQGSFLPNGSCAEEVQNYGGELERLFIESSCRWATILSETGRPDEAEQVLGTAVQQHPTNDDLIRCRYRLHCTSDKPAQAWQVLKQYETALQNEDYSTEEIEEILQAVSNSVS